jgi:hypothetical protein
MSKKKIVGQVLAKSLESKGQSFGIAFFLLVPSLSNYDPAELIIRFNWGWSSLI